MWDNGPLLNSESAGIRELLNPDRPIMYGREVSHGSGPISGVSVLPWWRQALSSVPAGFAAGLSSDAIAGVASIVVTDTTITSRSHRRRRLMRMGVPPSSRCTGRSSPPPLRVRKEM